MREAVSLQDLAREKGVQVFDKRFPASGEAPLLARQFKNYVVSGKWWGLLRERNGFDFPEDILLQEIKKRKSLRINTLLASFCANSGLCLPKINSATYICLLDWLREKLAEVGEIKLVHNQFRGNWCLLSEEGREDGF
ncbi:MAG: hypothetical protein ACOC6Q_01715 [Patescibacteria group bacterium]